MSFLEKLKKGIGIEDESSEEEDFEGEETSSLLPPRSARETEELKKPIQPKKQAKKIKAEEKFVEPQEEIPKEVVKEDKSSFSPSASARVTEEIKTKEKKWPEPEGQLAVDVYQTDGELVIQSTIAGIKPEDLDITVQEDTIIIRGKREKIGTEEKNYFYQECYWGPFSREIILPVEADASRAEASMKEGVLTIRMPKIEREKRKKIVVK